MAPHYSDEEALLFEGEFPFALPPLAGAPQAVLVYELHAGFRCLDLRTGGRWLRCMSRRQRPDSLEGGRSGLTT